MRVRMPISGEGVLSSPVMPKYGSDIEIARDYVFGASGEPLHVTLTVTDERGEELLEMPDVVKVSDETVVEALKRIGASEADIERTLVEWGVESA